MTYIEKFEELKKIIEASKKVKFAKEFAIQVNMTDSDCCGAFYIANVGGVFAVEPYDYHDYTAMITTESDVIKKILKGALKAENAFEDGLAVLHGDIESVKELLKIVKKAPAKEAAAKKAPAKKEKAVKEEKAEAPKKRTCAKKATPKAEEKVEVKAPAKAEAKAPAKKTAAKKATK